MRKRQQNLGTITLWQSEEDITENRKSGGINQCQLAPAGLSWSPINITAEGPQQYLAVKFYGPHLHANAKWTASSHVPKLEFHPQDRTSPVPGHQQPGAA
ncbi:hypothetical protein P4O66_016611 [Electrophorus voltai]|uniref:Uncharacterized protein n=1 Tax=Electrophorus voltai TaxID=2609070 RepID=A0AAD9DPA1_9TELE|nr:hypothetical protein P4O66_016611 [Electrophorus voltai]